MMCAEAKCPYGQRIRPEYHRDGTGRRRTAREMREEQRDDTGVKTTPWHAITGRTYHTETECIHGRRIRPDYRREGPGRWWCGNCKLIERRREMREARG